MKRLLLLTLLFLSVQIFTAFAQMMHGGTGFMFPDTLKQVTLTGKISIDSTHLMPLYYLDINGNGTNDYILNFGPVWYQPDSSKAVRPKNGDQVTIIGGLIDSVRNKSSIPMVIVYQINGELWRDPFDPQWNNFGSNTHMMGHHNGVCMGYAFGANTGKPQSVTLSGVALVDTTLFMNIYYLDENKDGKPDDLLNFGPWWYGLDSNVQRPKNGDTITISGGKLKSPNLPVIIVYKINGQLWRDSTLLGKYFGGGWMRRNNNNDTVKNPFDQNDFMMMSGNWHMGMMMSDSLFGRMIELNPMNIPNRGNEFIFKGYEFGMFNPNGSNGMMQGGNCGSMMSFGSNANFHFHFTDEQIQAYKLDKKTVTVKYWNNRNNQWISVKNPVINLTSNTITFSTNQVSSYYILTGDRLTDVKNEKAIPDKYSLAQNYPNPFNPSTTIKFELKQDAKVSLFVYNILGQKVAEILNNNELNAGSYSVNFDAGSLPSGIYFYELNADGKKFVKKMSLLK